MQKTRSVATLVLVGATAAALALGGATIAHASSDDPANRGWSSPVGQADEFAQTSGDD